jgi:hypothetical protein
VYTWRGTLSLSHWNQQKIASIEIESMKDNGDVRRVQWNLTAIKDIKCVTQFIIMVSYPAFDTES